MKYVCFLRPGVYGTHEDDTRPIIEDEDYDVTAHEGWKKGVWVQLERGTDIMVESERWGTGQEWTKEEWMEKVQKERQDPGGFLMQYAVLPLKIEK